jgi:hypothetical protein
MYSIMRVVTGSVAVVTAVSIAQVNPQVSPPCSRRTPSSSARPVEGTVQTLVEPLFVPASLEELVKYADVVIDGSVETVLSPRVRRADKPASLETDVVISIDEIVKGTAAWKSLKKAIVSQPGGKLGNLEVVTPQITRLQEGVRYILFLNSDTRFILPDYNGLPHFVITGIWTGQFDGTGGTIHVSNLAPDWTRAAHSNEKVEEFVKQIKAIAP